MDVRKKQVRLLHEQTGAGYLDIKRALDETNDDDSLAASILSENRMKIARKRTARLTKTGIIDSYIHTNHRIGALVEISCETEFIASSEVFRELARDMAMHITATNPSSIDDLLNQQYYRDPDKSVSDILLGCIASFKENVVVKRFIRYEVNENG